MTGSLPKRRRGCFFYGCLTSSALAVLVLIAVLLGLRYLKNLVLQSTDSEAALVPVAQVSPAQIEALQPRVDQFEKDLRAHRHAEPLTLTADDVNALIATNPDFKGARGKVYVGLEGDLITAQVSWPLEPTHLPFVRRRFLNGVVSFHLSLQNGQLWSKVESLRVKDRPAPRATLERLRRLNLTTGVNGDSRAASFLDRLQDIQVKEGKVTLVPKPE